MARKNLGVTHLRGRSPQRHQTSKYSAQKPNTPKSAREKRVLAPVPALVDPIGSLGHKPRPRTGRGVGRHVER